MLSLASRGAPSTTEALREAVRLQHNVIGADTATRDVEPMAVAV